MARGVFARFWMQPNLLLAPIIVRGIAVLVVPLQSKRSSRRGKLSQPQRKQSSGPRERYPSRLRPKNSDSVAQAHSSPKDPTNESHRGRNLLAAVCFSASVVIAMARRDVVASTTKEGYFWDSIDLQNRSTTVLGVGQYGHAILDSLPQRSLLLSHTDLNWNSVRYLQSCEGLRPDVVHLSLQLLPYVAHFRLLGACVVG